MKNINVLFHKYKNTLLKMYCFYGLAGGRKWEICLSLQIEDIQ